MESDGEFDGYDDYSEFEGDVVKLILDVVIEVGIEIVIVVEGVIV